MIKLKKKIQIKKLTKAKKKEKKRVSIKYERKKIKG
jgi:hypothetical protein